LKAERKSRVIGKTSNSLTKKINETKTRQEGVRHSPCGRAETRWTFLEGLWKRCKPQKTPIAKITSQKEKKKTRQFVHTQLFVFSWVAKNYASANTVTIASSISISAAAVVKRPRLMAISAGVSPYGAAAP
jgi:hypothetical protein